MECAKYDRAVIRELRRLGSLVGIKQIRAAVNLDRMEKVSPEQCARNIAKSIHWWDVQKAQSGR